MTRVLSSCLLLSLAACTGVVGGTGAGGGAATGGGETNLGGGSASTGGGSGGGSGGGLVGSGSGCDVQALVDARCNSCHTSPPANGAPVSFVTLASLRAPSSRDASKSNAERSVIRMQDPAFPMPPSPNAPASPGELATLSAWIAAGMPDCTTGPTDGGVTAELSPNLIPQDELFLCTGAVSDAPTRLRRLNRWEWTRDVGGAVSRSWTGFTFFDNPLDPSQGEPYSSYATDETLDEASIELLLPVMEEAGPPWAGPYTGDNRLERLRLDTSLRCMEDDAQPTEACVRHYLSEFLLHGVLFRPARPDELDRLTAFALQVLADEHTDGGNPDRVHTVTRISNAAWLTTGAMFRGELGGPADGGRVTLTDWERAQQLAYALGARAPGATPAWVYPDYSAPMEGHYADIAAAAVDGGIRDPNVVKQLVRRNAGGLDATRFDLVVDHSPGERAARGEFYLGDGVANFFREWLGYPKVEQIFKERPEALSQYDDGDQSPYRNQLSAWGNLMSGYYGDEATLVEQLDDTVARIVAEDQDVLATLLTSRRFFLASTANTGNYENAVLWTGEPYNTTQAIADDRAARWVTLPATERAGVLTHPAWLAAKGGNFEDDPSLVHRGKWVRESLLCDYVPPLSQVRVVAMVGPHAPDKSARARVDEATLQKPECLGCHTLMNPLGYPFEIYNHAGYLRVHDHAADGGWKPPDGRVTLTGMPDPALDGPVTDAVDLSQKLAVSGRAKRCFVRQTFRYFMGRNENRTDACTLAAMEQAYDSNHGSFFSMLEALTTSDTWSTRRAPEAGE